MDENFSKILEEVLENQKIIVNLFHSSTSIPTMVFYGVSVALVTGIAALVAVWLTIQNQKNLEFERSKSENTNRNKALFLDKFEEAYPLTFEIDAWVQRVVIKTLSDFSDLHSSNPQDQLTTLKKILDDKQLHMFYMYPYDSFRKLYALGYVYLPALRKTIDELQQSISKFSDSIGNAFHNAAQSKNYDYLQYDVEIQKTVNEVHRQTFFVRKALEMAADNVMNKDIAIPFRWKNVE